MKWSNILLILGMLILVVGAIMSVMKLQPYSDYTLVVGAVVILFRGAVRQREKNQD